jgi:hypothetical protein
MAAESRYTSTAPSPLPTDTAATDLSAVPIGALSARRRSAPFCSPIGRFDDSVGQRADLEASITQALEKYRDVDATRPHSRIEEKSQLSCRV